MLTAAEVEIRDLTSEFEDERRDYLETIRSQTKQMQLVEAILEKVQPLIQRDCNYFNMRRVKEEANYDIDAQCWRLPEVQLIKTNLPSLGQDSSNGQKNSGPFNTKTQRVGSNMTQYPPEQQSHGLKLLEDSGSQDDVFQNYMKPKRAQKILEQGAANRKISESNGYHHSVTNGGGSSRFAHLNQSANVGSNIEPYSPGTRRGSHQVLDQSFSSPTMASGGGLNDSFTGVSSPSSQFEIPNPKNVRLEKLDLTAERPISKTKRKKKEKTFIS